MSKRVEKGGSEREEADGGVGTILLAENRGGLNSHFQVGGVRTLTMRRTIHSAVCVPSTWSVKPACPNPFFTRTKASGRFSQFFKVTVPDFTIGTTVFSFLGTQESPIPSSLQIGNVGGRTGCRLPG